MVTEAFAEKKSVSMNTDCIPSGPLSSGPRFLQIHGGRGCEVIAGLYSKVPECCRRRVEAGPLHMDGEFSGRCKRPVSPVTLV